MPSSSADRLRAVIFDVDGTLVDSEQRGHRLAFNEALAAFGLPDRWGPALYRELLAVTGGEARLVEWFRRPASSLHGLPEGEVRHLARHIHRWKTGRFQQMAVEGAVPAREGAGDLLDELTAAGFDVCVATTGSRAWVLPLLDCLFGADRFSLVVTGDDVAARKPDPEAYLLVLARRGLGAGDALAIEDSGPGVRAATAAGLACVAVANQDTDLDGVGGADLVVAGFGSEGCPMRVHADPHRVAGEARLSVQTLEAVWRASHGTNGLTQPSTRSSN